MANDDRRSISFALIGHGGDGKTTLADSLLFAAGVTSRLGRVDDGTSFMNWLPEEKVRRASISTSVCSFAHGDAEFTMLDVPGDANFGGFIQQALSTDLLNSAIAGGGLLTSMMSYLYSADFQSAPATRTSICAASTRPGST